MEESESEAASMEVTETEISNWRYMHFESCLRDNLIDQQWRQHQLLLRRRQTTGGAGDDSSNKSTE